MITLAKLQIKEKIECWYHLLTLQKLPITFEQGSTKVWTHWIWTAGPTVQFEQQFYWKQTWKDTNGLATYLLHRNHLLCFRDATQLVLLCARSPIGVYQEGWVVMVKCLPNWGLYRSPTKTYLSFLKVYLRNQGTILTCIKILIHHAIITWRPCIPIIQIQMSNN